jgi:hypothetical protein
MMNCFIGQASQQMANGIADALAAQTIRLTLDKLKKDISSLKLALYKQSLRSNLILITFH